MTERAALNFDPESVLFVPFVPSEFTDTLTHHFPLTPREPPATSSPFLQTHSPPPAPPGSTAPK